MTRITYSIKQQAHFGPGNEFEVAILPHKHNYYKFYHIKKEKYGRYGRYEEGELIPKSEMSDTDRFVMTNNFYYPTVGDYIRDISFCPFCGIDLRKYLEEII